MFYYHHNKNTEKYCKYIDDDAETSKCIVGSDVNN